MSDVRCHVRDNVRDNVRDDGRDGELSNHRIPFIYAGFRRSMVGTLGLFEKLRGGGNQWGIKNLSLRFLLNLKYTIISISVISVVFKGTPQSDLFILYIIYIINNQ